MLFAIRKVSVFRCFFFRSSAAALALAFSAAAMAQQPGPFTAQDFRFSGSPELQMPSHLYGPDLDGSTPSEIALSPGAVKQRLQRLGFHSISSIRFRGGYWNVVAYNGKKKRQLTVHPESGAIRSDRPYCNNRCNRYPLSEEF
ncbi:hypothetical protein ACONUD_02665 [Microbulbifer harenosus]|uniref:PepSY domain-containing protein n=1 Tax=Microbulbifer harenosus TaxID=2576840 RepID=A0ABY2UD63_9GAMM|nr:MULTISPECIES: hypothetical protein [Microbulbifer]QIL89616.1 hypothetical protein GNX18_07515 [Microbulbifer sp. SH-1]TLM73947.1 hypothetical protein FDY93_18620 [Microbulbifer harenosus]